MDSEKMRIGPGTKVWRRELCNLFGCAIGCDCNIAAFCEIGPGARIGDRCRVGAFGFIPGGVWIGEDVWIGPRVTFTNDKHPPNADWHKERQTIVEDEAVIGAGVVVLPGVKIGKGALIGAGSVVTRDIEPGAVAYGNPARKVRDK